MFEEKGEFGLQSLPLLQNRLKKDPESYKDSFESATETFNKLWETFLLSPSNHAEELVSLVMFLAQVSHCYKEQSKELSSRLMSVLGKYGPQLDADMRLTFCRALILMRNKNLISAVAILQLFFGLFRCQDKVLRETLRNYIVQDIKNVNKKSKNASLNSALQNFMFVMLKDDNAVAAKISLDIVIELYHRRIWNDSKTANIISTALFSKSNKLVVAALKFFIGSENGNVESDSDDDEPKEKRNSTQLQLAFRVAKKTKKREKRLNRALDMINNQKKKRKKVVGCFSAIHLINDPQELAEKVFAQLERPKANDLFSVKVLKLNFVSQLIGIHKLILLQFYPFFDRYLKHSQNEVTKLLLFLAQACHEMVPPDIILSSMRTIANNFISERNSNEVMAVGLNAIREISNRCPIAMDEDLLHDLALFKKSKDKCVSTAAQSLIGLFRKKNPTLLHRSFRGRATAATAENKVLDFGELDARDHLPGAEILPDEEELNKNKETEKEQDGWESCSEDEEVEEDDSDGSWIDVSHSSDEEVDSSKVQEMTKEEKLEKSKKILESRILTDEDFKKIQAFQRSKETESTKKSGKRIHAETIDEEGGELISLSRIENVNKKRKHDKESRMETVMAGREGRGKFGSREKKSNGPAASSNRKKLRNKNFMMVRHKVVKEKKATFQQKKETLKKHLLSKLKQKSK